MLVDETWAVEGRVGVLAPGDVVSVLRRRVDDDQRETWLTSSSGRSLAFVTNTERVMVMLLEGAGDPGEHAVDPEAEDPEEFGDGYTLANGQDDEYPNGETVPFDSALMAVEHIVRTGSWPAETHWVSDR
ncbi:Imm1 family immunity protein [Micromonospora peucetia]|uniref:Imm1 family immunity protein n=1 Tax=Micromonospora peucetia TaxID=47871 RepID=UPI00331E6ACC